MKTIITVTRKGQTTLPIAVRRKLGLTTSGGSLQASFDDAKGELVISRLVDIVELAQRVSRHVKPDTKPILSVDEYYQAHRGDSS